MRVLLIPLGLLTSSVLAYPIVDYLIHKKAWRYYVDHNWAARDKTPSEKTFTIWLGIVERLLYTLALIIGAHEWIAAWLALKTVVQWKRWTTEQSRDPYSIFLIGSALSLFFGALGAWIALGFPLPCFRR